MPYKGPERGAFLYTIFEAPTLRAPMDQNEKRLADAVAKQENKHRIYTDTLHALRTEERFVNFLGRYEPRSVEQFIEYYAQQKATWLTNEHSRQDFEEFMSEHDRKRLVGLLACIMEKKVFDLQCRWVAGQVDVPGVEVSLDFSNWRQNTAIQQAAGTISEAEMMCFLGFLEMSAAKRMTPMMTADSLKDGMHSSSTITTAPMCTMTVSGTCPIGSMNTTDISARHRCGTYRTPGPTLRWTTTFCTRSTYAYRH